jgi:hypothetical protein
LQRRKRAGNGCDIDAEQARDFAMGRQPFASDQLTARDAITDCIRQTLIKRPFVVRQLQIVEHACFCVPAFLSQQQPLAQAGMPDSRAWPTS